MAHPVELSSHEWAMHALHATQEEAVYRIHRATVSVYTDM